MDQNQRPDEQVMSMEILTTDIPRRFPSTLDQPIDQTSNKNTEDTKSDDTDSLQGDESRESKHSSLIGVIAFAIFTGICIFIGVLVVYFALQKDTHKACQYRFKPSAHIAEGFESHPHDVAVGDFNNDTQLDIVVTNSGMDNIGIYLGFGNGSFASPIIYPTGHDSRPYALDVGDFNNDHLLDIVVAHYATNTLGVFLAYENISFSSQIITSLGSSHPLALDVGYVNNDTLLDVVIANYGTLDITILHGYNNGSFRIDFIYDMGYDSIPYSLVIADFNHDYCYDIGVVNYGTNELVILMNDQNQSFIMQKYYTENNSHPCSISVGDVNNDNEVDVIIANSGNSSVGIFIGYGNGSFGKQTRHSTGIGSHPRSVTVGNLNDQKNTDVVVIDSVNNEVLVMKGYGNGSLSLMTTHSTGYNSQPISIDVGDFDHDNIPDIVIADNHTNYVLVLYKYYSYPIADQYIYWPSDNNSPRFVAIGDLNHDNLLDMVVTYSDIDYVAIWMNVGDGVFTEESWFYTQANHRTNFVVLADVNKDAELDIIVVMTGISTIGIWFGYGNGSFYEGPSYITGSNASPELVVVTDLNNDTNLDIIIPNYYANNIGILLGIGNGSFIYSDNYLNATDFYPYAIAVGDMNNDTYMDVIAVGYHGYIGILLGYGNGSFDEPTFIFTNDGNLQCVMVGDLNNDTYQDIVYISPSFFTIGVLLGYGNGYFQNITRYYGIRGSYPFYALLTDLNNDKIFDILVSYLYDSSIGIFFGIGNGTFKEQIVWAVKDHSAPYSLAVGDLDNDDQTDIVGANYADNNLVLIFINYHKDFGNETFYLTALGPHPYSVIIGDINTNNQSDVIVANSGNDNIQINLDYSKGNFTNHLFYSTGPDSYPHFVSMADFNNDNNLDLVVVSYVMGNLNVFYGKGNGTFDKPSIHSTGALSFPNALAISNFNNNSFMDIVVANSGGDNIAVFLGYPYVTFSTRTIDVPGGTPTPLHLAVADFNNDQNCDLVVANVDVNNIGIYLGYGNGTFSQQITYLTGSKSAPYAVVTGDFNNDNQSDIAVANIDNGTIGIFLGYGNGSFQDQETYSTGSSSAPNSLAVGDFNNDSRLDIVVANRYTNNIYTFLGYGNGSFSTPIIHWLAVGSAPYWIIVGDVNNDHILDVGVANFNASNIGIFLGYGNGSLGQLITILTGNNSNPRSIAFGDLNQDKALDLIVADNGDKTIKGFYGHGNGSFSLHTTYHLEQEAVMRMVSVDDINDDKLLDIVVVEYYLLGGNIRIFYGLGNGKFMLPKIYSTGLNSYPSSVIVCDFNNDNQVDIAVTKSNKDSIDILLHYKNEPFATPANYSMGNNSLPSSVAVDDLNNDQHVDIIVTNSGTDNILILFGYGNGSFHDQLIYPTGSDSNPFSVTTGDFNHDHHIDIAYVNAGIDTLDILLNYGNGTFYHFITYSTGLQSEPSFITSNYLDKDDDLDLVVANWGTNNIHVYYGLGNGTFLQPKIYTLGYDARPTSIGIGDIDNNGLLDLAVANSASDYVEILLQIC